MDEHQHHGHGPRHTGGVATDRLTFAVSLARLNPLRLEEELHGLADAGCAELHIRITDGHFAPGFTYGVDAVEAIAGAAKMPCTVHLMIADPDAYLNAFIKAGCKTVVIPVEAPHHLHRTLSQVRDLGAQVAVSINPATPLTALEYVLHMVDRVQVMAVDAGFRPRLVDNAFDRVRILRENIAYHEFRTALAVDGGLNAQNAAIFANAGAEVFVLDATGLPEGNLGAGLNAFKAKVAEQRHLV